MPTPIMPKRTRSLAATAPGPGMRSCGNNTIGFAASDAPAAALAPRNSRRDQLFFFTASPMSDVVVKGRPHYAGLLGLLPLATTAPHDQGLLQYTALHGPAAVSAHSLGHSAVL